MSAGDNFSERGFLFRRGGSVDAFVNRIPQVASEFAVDFARIFSQARRDFRREQTRDDSVFVGGPHAAVARRNEEPALSSPAKPSRPASRPSTNHLKPTGHLVQPAPQPRADAIDHAAAHHRFPDGDVLAPVLPIRKQVVDADRKIVIRREASRSPWSRCRGGRGRYQLANAMSNLSFSPISRCMA